MYQNASCSVERQSGRLSKVINLSVKTRLGLLIKHRFAERFIKDL